MRPRTRKDFAIAIICALPLEIDAVEALFDEQYDRFGKYYGRQPGDANQYINGRIGKHPVVLCYMPGMGKGNAAGVAAGLIVSYVGVELVLVVGICGGAPPPPKYQEIFLGDVIISDTVVEYDFGRQYPGGFRRKTGVQDTLGRPSRAIRTLLNGLRTENARRELQDQTQKYLHILQQRGAKWDRPNAEDILFSASYLHKHQIHASTGCSCLESDYPGNICEVAIGQSCNELECDKGQVIRRRELSEPVQVHIGTVASADTVMKSGQHRDGIVYKENAIGFEMEGAGVWDHVSCIIIKGVCDYADSHKNKSWQAYAAATGASAAKAFLEECWMPGNHEDTVLRQIEPESGATPSNIVVRKRYTRDYHSDGSSSSLDEGNKRARMVDLRSLPSDQESDTTQYDGENIFDGYTSQDFRNTPEFAQNSVVSESSLDIHTDEGSNGENSSLSGEWDSSEERLGSEDEFQSESDIQTNDETSDY